VGRQRPIVIQSLFPAIGGEEPPLEEIEQYARRLLELKEAGADISLVQIYSATRPSANSACGHLPLRVLSRIAQTVRQTTGLKAEVFSGSCCTFILNRLSAAGLLLWPAALFFQPCAASIGVRSSTGQ